MKAGTNLSIPTVSGQCAVAILAGGESRRMGRDKAALTLHGGTLLGRAARAAIDAGAAAVLVIGRERPAGWDGPDEVVFVRDPAGRARQGPLAGIVTALEETHRRSIPAVIAVACDMPWLGADALRWLQGVDPDEHGTVALGGDGALEPLFALYRIAALPLLSGCLEAGARSPRRCLARGRFAHPPVPARLLPALEDVDTPEDLDRARRRNSPDSSPSET